MRCSGPGMAAGGRYTCDYCNVSFKDVHGARDRHFASRSHQRRVCEVYQATGAGCGPCFPLVRAPAAALRYSAPLCAGRAAPGRLPGGACRAHREGGSESCGARFAPRPAPAPRPAVPNCPHRVLPFGPQWARSRSGAPCCRGRGRRLTRRPPPLKQAQGQRSTGRTTACSTSHQTWPTSCAAPRRRGRRPRFPPRCGPCPPLLRLRRRGLRGDGNTGEGSCAATQKSKECGRSALFFQGAAPTLC